jgi:hypothetical protein
MEQEEIWKDIEGYGGKYKISSFGRCLTARGNEFKYSNANGYRMVILYDLSKKGCYKGHLVHRLVAQAFVPNIENKPQVNHKDKIKTNNNVKNLEWVTCSENHIHAFKNGRIPIRGERCKSSKITDNQAIEIKKLILNGHTIKDICEITKISYYIVKGIKTYKKWNHITI